MLLPMKLLRSGVRNTAANAMMIMGSMRVNMFLTENIDEFCVLNSDMIIIEAKTIDISELREYVGISTITVAMVRYRLRRLR